MSAYRGANGIHFVILSMGYDIAYITDSHICNNSIETSWFFLRLKRSRPTYMCFFYRPPSGNASDALLNLEQQYDKIVAHPGADVIFMGDMNIDYSLHNLNFRKLHAFLKHHHLDQLVDKPTRVTNTSKTIIDHIYCNNNSLYNHHWHDRSWP